MAERKEVYVVDDLTGERGARPEKFGFGGYLYEIDLTENNRAELHALLKRYAEKARRIGKIKGVRPVQQHPVSAPPAPSNEPPPLAETPESRREIRHWWRSNHRRLGLAMPTERGRIPQAVREAYEEQVVKPTSGAPAFSDAPDDPPVKARRRVAA